MTKPLCTWPRCQCRVSTGPCPKETLQQKLEPVFTEAKRLAFIDMNGRPPNDADVCRQNNWGPGTRLVGDEGYGPTVIEIRYVGESKIFAKAISHNHKVVNWGESIWTLSCREWKRWDHRDLDQRKRSAGPHVMVHKQLLEQLRQRETEISDRVRNETMDMVRCGLGAVGKESIAECVDRREKAAAKKARREEAERQGRAALDRLSELSEGE